MAVKKRKRVSVGESMRAIEDGIRSVLGDGWLVCVDIDPNNDAFRAIVRVGQPLFGIVPYHPEMTTDGLRRAGKRIGDAAVRWRKSGCKGQ